MRFSTKINLDTYTLRTISITSVVLTPLKHKSLKVDNSSNFCFTHETEITFPFYGKEVCIYI